MCGSVMKKILDVQQVSPKINKHSFLSTILKQYELKIILITVGFENELLATF